MMIREQDRTIDSIAGTLSTLAQQAGLMGQEIVEHTECVPTDHGLSAHQSKIAYQNAGGYRTRCGQLKCKVKQCDEAYA